MESEYNELNSSDVQAASGTTELFLGYILVVEFKDGTTRRYPNVYSTKGFIDDVISLLDYKGTVIGIISGDCIKSIFWEAK